MYAAPLKARVAELEALLAAATAQGLGSIDDKEIHTVPT
jgi:hypothetical protein